jgi:hypothetical protein
MNVTTQIIVDRRGVTVLWLALGLAAVGLGLVIGLANVPGEAASVPNTAPKPAAIESERFAVAHGVYPAAPAALPTCGRSTVTGERDAVRRGAYPTGLAAIESCALQAANARELDAIRRVWPAPPDAADASWSIDWKNFHGRP